MAKSYREKLADPRWQRKRLEILERDEWTCQNCGRDDKTLHVHHGYYERGLDPWEYADETLWTLCWECHEEAEAERTILYRLIGELHPAWINKINGYVLAETVCGIDEDEASNTFILVNNSMKAMGVANSFMLPIRRVAELVKDDYVRVGDLMRLQESKGSPE